ncbi:MAG: hypothetical protein ACLGIN_07025 [Candidatus Sericytochromatia bacterium]
MGTSKHIARMALVASVVLMTSGCKFFDLSNPLLPEARFLAEPEPSMVTVTYDYRISDRTITAQPQDATYRIFSYPRDGTPGAFIHSYSVEYFDMNNKPIPTLYLAKANFGVAKYIPPASSAAGGAGGATGGVTMALPVYNQQVKLYGSEYAYSTAGPIIDLNRNFSHVITARVTLYAEDDNYNQIEIPFNVPIKFEANVVQ